MKWNTRRRAKNAKRFASEKRQKTDRVGNLRAWLPPGQPEKGLQGTRPWGLTCPITSRTCAGSPFFQIETIVSFTLDPRDLLIPTRPSRRNRIFHWTNWKEPGYVSSVSLQGPIVVSHCCTTTSHSSGMKEIFSSEVNAS